MSARPATIEHCKDGLTVFAGADAVAVYQLIALRSALRMEQRGMKLSRGASALKTAKRLTGLRTNDRAVQITALEGMLKAAGDKVQHIVHTDALAQDAKKEAQS